MTSNESESVAMIRDSVGAIAPRGGDLKRIRALRFETPGIDRGIWREMAALGWLALRLPEDRDGLGMGMRELCVIAEELGAGLVPEPVIAAAAIVPLLPQHLRAAVLAGEMLVLPAWQEQPGAFAPGLATRFVDGLLHGAKILVPFATAADAFLVTTDRGLALVRRDAPGVTIVPQQSQDGGQFGNVTFAGAVAESVPGALDDILEDIMLAHSAYLLGASERAFAMALEYLGIRKQFGKFIGSFQVLQHRAAELKVQLALSRAILNEAMAVADSAAPAATRHKVGSRAKARIADTAILVARETIQMHGAVGITDEYDIGLYCRKIVSLYNLYGSAAWHRARYLRLAAMPGDAT